MRFPGGFRARRWALILILVLVAASATVAGLTILGRQTNPPGNSKTEVKVSYSSRYSNTIDGFVAPSGQTYLVVNLTVFNMGYTNFTADPFRDMYVQINGQICNVSATFLFLTHPFQSMNLANQATATGDVSFQVPQGTISFSARWRAPSGFQVVFSVY